MDSPQRGTVDAAMEVKTFIEESVRLKQCTVIVSLDAKGSFIHIFYLFIYLFTAIWLLPGGSGYFTCKQNIKLVTNKFKSGGLHEKHIVATWNVGNRLSVCL